MAGLAATQVAAFEVAGTMSPASPTWQRETPADPDAVDLDCGLRLDGAQLERPSPYAMYCVRAADAQPVEIWTILSGTDYDPVLYLYCESFDGSDPRQGLIAFDDDDGPGAMAMFGAWDGLSLVPDRIYWLMIAWFDSMDWGHYALHGSDNLELCAVPVASVAWGAFKSRYR